MSLPSPQTKKLKVCSNSVNPKLVNVTRKEQLTAEIEKILVTASEAATTLEKILATKEQLIVALEKIPTEITPPIVAVSSRGTACVAAGTAVVAVNDGGSGDALRLDGPFLPHSSGLDDTTNIKYHYRVGPRKLGQCSIMSFIDSVQRGAPTPSEK